MTSMRGYAVVLAVSAVLALAGCSRPDPEPAPSGTEPAATLAPTPTPTPTPASCLVGHFLVTGFTATSNDGTGSGGDLTATFDPAGTFVLSGGGQSPLQVTVSGRQAEALVTGTISGTYTDDGPTGTYAVTASEGSAKVSLGILHRTVPMSDVVKLLTTDGTGTLSCAGDDAAMTSSASQLTLHRG